MVERKGFIIPKYVVWTIIGFLCTSGVGSAIPASISVYNSVSFTSSLQEKDKDGKTKLERMSDEITFMRAQIKDLHDFMIAQKSRGHTNAKAITAEPVARRNG